MKTIIFFILLISSPATASNTPSDECIKWLQSAGIKPNAKNCEPKCLLLETDMATFMCPNQCDELCGDRNSSTPNKWLYYPGLTEAEKKLVEKYPKEAIIVFIQKTKAERSTSRNFPDQGLNDESDAFRHFIWAGLLTRELGEEKALKYLNAHEANPLQAQPEKDMDDHNNSLGQKTAINLIKNKNWSQRTLESEGLKALKAKKLQVLKPGLDIPEKPQ